MKDLVWFNLHCFLSTWNLVICKVLVIVLCSCIQWFEIWERIAVFAEFPPPDAHALSEYISSQSHPGRTAYGATPSPTSLTLVLGSISSFWHCQNNDTDEMLNIYFTSTPGKSKPFHSDLTETLTQNLSLDKFCATLIPHLIYHIMPIR